MGTRVKSTLKYTGEKQPTPEQISRGILPYRPSPRLVEAVNLAIYLERPLLLKGEPGSGKTRLADHVAFELGLGAVLACHVTSTHHARDLAYTYDTLARLRDSQLSATNGQLNSSTSVLEDAEYPYVRWGPLGVALRSATRRVVLIDEIDKADIDFPNDLLLELDQHWFRISELDEKVEAREDARPIMFITSNDEKDLPDAFLRRCVFHYVEFPDTQRLKDIVNLHVREASAEMVDAAIARFEQLHKDMKSRTTPNKAVSTAELLDWIEALLRFYDPEKLVRALHAGKLPLSSVLLKSKEDLDRYAPDETTANATGTKA